MKSPGLEQRETWATHPFDKLWAGSCQKREDRAPSVGTVHAKIVKVGPPAKIQSRRLSR